MFDMNLSDVMDQNIARTSTSSVTLLTNGKDVGPRTAKI